METLSPFSEASNLLSQSIGTIKQTYLQKRHQNPSNNTFLFFFFWDQKLFFGASSHKQLFCFSHNLCKNPEYHWIRINYVCQRKNGSIISFLDWEISHAQYRQKSALQISTLKHPSSNWTIFVAAALNWIKLEPLESGLQELFKDCKNTKIQVLEVLQTAAQR